MKEAVNHTKTGLKKFAWVLKKNVEGKMDSGYCTELDVSLEPGTDQLK